MSGAVAVKVMITVEGVDVTTLWDRRGECSMCQTLSSHLFNPLMFIHQQDVLIFTFLNLR